MQTLTATATEFGNDLPKHHTHRLEDVRAELGSWSTSLNTYFIGLSVRVTGNEAAVAIVAHDGVYMTDYAILDIDLKGGDDGTKDVIADEVIGKIRLYERKHYNKIIGAGISRELDQLSPQLASRMWLELDIVPMIMSAIKETAARMDGRSVWSEKSVDEQAESMARKCVLFFGPALVPTLQVGYRGLVEVDAGLRAKMVTLEDNRRTCGPSTWDATLKYAANLKKSGTKIAFFSATPQGGGVALMRHALVRFAHLLDVDLSWYVPKPKPGVFRITKTVHNTLQGVQRSDERITAEDKETLTSWIEENAHRYWIPKGGPLSHPSEGGANIIIVDDPQMPGIIPVAKKICPERPILFRSHIQIRADLADEKGTPQSDIWHYLWQSIKQSDMYISHPIPSFVPKDVPREKVAYLPATTDWLDGLNKPLEEWDEGYYGNIYNNLCAGSGMTGLKYPARKYIIQVARFDPSKGIPDVIKAYGEFRKTLREKGEDDNPPQLLIVGNGSVDDPDGTQIYDDTLEILEKDFASLKDCVSVMRLRANDQLLNTLISNAHIALQLSTREGFEVKVSEAIHKGVPIIATLAGGIPLQVQHGKNGFLVETGDHHAVAQYLYDLWTDHALYKRLSEYALKSVSDEVGTVGNALSWFYLVDKWVNGQGIQPRERWVNDLAREEAGKPYQEGENRLPRTLVLPSGEERKIGKV